MKGTGSQKKQKVSPKTHEEALKRVRDKLVKKRVVAMKEGGGQVGFYEKEDFEGFKFNPTGVDDVVVLFGGNDTHVSNPGSGGGGQAAAAGPASDPDFGGTFAFPITTQSYKEGFFGAVDGDVQKSLGLKNINLEIKVLEKALEAGAKIVIPCDNDPRPSMPGNLSHKVFGGGENDLADSVKDKIVNLQSLIVLDHLDGFAAVSQLRNFVRARANFVRGKGFGKYVKWLEEYFLENEFCSLEDLVPALNTEIERTHEQSPAVKLQRRGRRDDVLGASDLREQREPEEFLPKEKVDSGLIDASSGLPESELPQVYEEILITEINRVEDSQYAESALKGLGEDLVLLRPSSPQINPDEALDKFDFSTKNRGVINNPNSARGIIQENLIKAADELSIEDPGLFAIISILAIKNGGVGRKEEEFKADLRTRFGNDVINAEMIDEIFKVAVKFSRSFQDKMEKLAIFTGNHNAQQIVGMRLKRITPDHIVEAINMGWSEGNSWDDFASDEQDHGSQIVSNVLQQLNLQAEKLLTKTTPSPDLRGADGRKIVSDSERWEVESETSTDGARWQ